MKQTFIILMQLTSLLVVANAQPIDPAIKTKFDKIIDSHFKSDEPGGTVLVAQRGKILYERGFGLANLELSVKMQPEMLFEIGSQTKQFTAVSILQLMEQGKLSLNDPITRYIDSCPTYWQQVTIENLMTHSSGISDVGNVRMEATTENIIEAAKKQPLSYAPGTKTFYANIEFVLLGAIIEKLSGQTVGNYFKENILKPLNMKHTYCNTNNAVIPNRSAAYLKRSIGFTNTPTVNTVGGAGGLISNTYDMLIWYEALAAGKVVKKETLDRAWKQYVLADGKPSNFGYGWNAGGSVQGSQITEHGGMAGGYCTDALYLPKEQVFVAVFLNQRGYPDPIAQDMAALLIGKPYPMDTVRLLVEELKEYTGSYEVSDGTKRKVLLTNDKLYCETSDGRSKLLMVPYSKDQFNLAGSLWTFSFQRDNRGKITGVIRFDKRYNTLSQSWKRLETEIK
jgi:CubicO group peptidase (beta-lactamase class C family)